MMKRITLLILLIVSSIAKPALADACLHAPAPRLRVGGEAVVAAGVGPLNVRALPAVDTGISVQVYGGNKLTVIGGPSCNGLYTWWRVESANGSRGWVAEGTWKQYFVVPLEDAEAPPDPFEGGCVQPFDSLFCL